MQKYQSRILLRLTSNIHAKLKARATERGRSINSLIEQYVIQGLNSGVDHETWEALKKEAKRLYKKNLIGLLLFGSQARGDVHDQSDTDILIVVTPNIRIERDLYRPWDSRLADNISVNITNLPKTATDAGSLWLECALDAQIIYDPSAQIKTMLSCIRELITSGKVRRHVTHGQGFWVNYGG